MKTDEQSGGWDWKTWLGLGLTAVWLFASSWYLTSEVGWKNLYAMMPNEIGDTLAGFAAPLAFLWLVLGYLLQRDELALQRKEVARLGDEYGKQREAVEANELHARRATFLDLYRFLWDEANAASVEMMRWMGAHAEGEVEQAWRHYSEGYSDAQFELIRRTLFRSLLAEGTEKQAHFSKVYKNAIDRFLRNFELLAGEARHSGDVIAKAVILGAMGTVYGGLCLIAGDATRQLNGFGSYRSPFKSLEEAIRGGDSTDRASGT